MSNKHHWFLFSFLLSLFLSAEPLYLFWLDEGASSALLVLFYIAFVSLLVLVAIFLISLPHQYIWPVLLSFFIAFSILELKLIYFDYVADFVDTSISVMLVILSALIYRFIISRKEQLKPTPALYVICFSIFVVGPLLGDTSREHDSSEPAESEQEFLDQLANVEFIDKPNIYILSYDSMISSLTARRYLGIEELPYEPVLDMHFRSLNPAAVIAVPTGPSLEGLMRMDQERSPMGFGYFAGRKRSPLVELFKSNGYQATTGYTTQYFGEKGPYIDRYVIGQSKPLSKTTQCIDLNERRLYMRLRAFGVCQAIGDYSNSIQVIGILSGEKKYANEDWHETVLNEIEIAAASAQPQLKIFYTYRPNGHTPKGYRHSDLRQREIYREYFLDGANMLSAIIEEIALTIQSKDPRGVVLVFGDHGAFLSRGLKASDDPDFFFGDRHIVYTGVMATEHHCTARENISRYSPGYFTPSRVVASIANCLTKDNALDSLLSFREPPELVKTLSDLGD